MTAVEPRCLTFQVEGSQADADHVRTRLTSRLRCASQLACAQAVSCSDDAVQRLRQLIKRSAAKE